MYVYSNIRAISCTLRKVLHPPQKGIFSDCNTSSSLLAKSSSVRCTQYTFEAPLGTMQVPAS